MAEKLKEEMSSAQQEAIQAEMAARGRRFLPKQVIARVLDPKSGAQELGSARRHKAALEAKRASLAKAPALKAAPAEKSKSEKAAAKK